MNGPPPSLTQTRSRNGDGAPPLRGGAAPSSGGGRRTPLPNQRNALAPGWVVLLPLAWSSPGLPLAWSSSCPPLGRPPIPALRGRPRAAAARTPPRPRTRTPPRPRTRAPPRPRARTAASAPRHPRSKHYKKRNDKSATNGMMRGAAETPSGELQQRRSVSEGGEHGIQSRDPGRSGPPGISRRPAGTLSEGTRASHVIRVTSAAGQTEMCSPMQPKILFMPALPAVTTGAHPAPGRGVTSHER